MESLSGQITNLNIRSVPRANLPISQDFRLPIPEANPVSKASIADISQYSPEILCLYVQRGNAPNKRGNNYQLSGQWANIQILRHEAIKKRTIIVPSKLVRENVYIVSNDKELGYPINNEDGPYQVVAVLDAPGEDINIGSNLLKLIELLDIEPNNVKETLDTINNLNLLGIALEPSYQRILDKLRKSLYADDLKKIAPIAMIYYRLGYYLLVDRSESEGEIYIEKGDMLDITQGSMTDKAHDNIILPALTTKAAGYQKLIKGLNERKGLEKGAVILDSMLTSVLIVSGTSSMDTFDYTELDGIFDLGRYFDSKKFVKIFTEALLSQGGWRLLKIGDISQVKVIGKISYR